MIENPQELVDALKTSRKLGTYYIRIENGKFDELSYIRHKHRYVHVNDRLDEFKLPDAYNMRWIPDFKFIGLLISLIGLFFIPIPTEPAYYAVLGLLCIITCLCLWYVMKPETDYVRMMRIINTIIDNHERLDNIEKGLHLLLDDAPITRRMFSVKRSVNRSLHGKRKMIRTLLEDINDRKGKLS